MPLGGLYGVVLGYLVTRKRIPGGRSMEAVSMINYALPGTIVGIAYLVAFYAALATMFIVVAWLASLRVRNYERGQPDDRRTTKRNAEKRFKEATEAYEVLRDPDKRARYDRYGHAGLEGMGGPNFQDARSVFDLFGNLFGDIMGGGTGRNGPQHGRDLQYNLDIDLAEAYKGVRKTFTIPREELCAECGGHGAKRGTKPAVCRRCNGQGAVIQRQGFFSVPRLQHAEALALERVGEQLLNGVLVVDEEDCRGVGHVARLSVACRRPGAR